MRVRLLSLVPLLLAGCAGGTIDDGVACTADYETISNPAYVGSYSASFTPGIAATLSDATESFSFSVAPDGRVTGTAFEAASQSRVPATGQAVDFRSGCDSSQMTVVLEFTPSGGATKRLYTDKRRNGGVSGRFTGNLYAGDVAQEGFLVVAPSASG